MSPARQTASPDGATYSQVLLRGRLSGVTKVDLQREDALVRIEVHLDAAAATVLSDLPNRLIAQGFRVRRFTEERPDLETAFMRLTKGLVS